MRIKKIFYPLAMALVITACANGANEKEVKNDQVSQAEEKAEQKEAESDTKIEDAKDTEENPEDAKSSEVPKLDKTYYDYFDTVTTLLTYSDDEESFKKQCDVLEEELAKYHKLYNSYDSFEGVNNFRTINEKAGIEPVKVDPEIIELIEYSKEMYELTDGNINVAMGSLLGLWHQYREMSIDN
ncbi:MAG: FAD:protein FMN transferase, partial [Anaerococcus prevotii]|nr:FAD:protein FMN transferase [Anaerococcus prevotii]